MQQVGSAGLAFAAFGLLVLAVRWPEAVAEVLHSRLLISLLAVWTGALAFFLHPELRAGLALGIREFRRASEEVARELRGDDDDGGPHAA